MRILFVINRVILFLFALFVLGTFSHDAQARERTAREFQKEVKKYLGIPYRLGCSSKKGMDCSGLVKQIYLKVFGIELPRHSSHQSSFPMLAKVPEDELNPGDLIFFSADRKRKRINHVGIYLSDSNFIHAVRNKGVTISSLKNQYWRSRIRAMKRHVDLDLRQDWAFPLLETKWDLFRNNQSAFRMQYSAYDYGRFHLQSDGFDPIFPHESLVLTDRRPDRLHVFELGYLRTLQDDLSKFQLSAFREKAPIDALLNEDRLAPVRSHTGRVLPYDQSDSVYCQGIKIASDITMFQRMRVTPSLAYSEYEYKTDEYDLPRRSLDLGLQFASLTNSWSLSTALQYSDQKDLDTRLFDSTDNRITLDVSFTLRHRLADYLEFSLMGQRSVTTASSLEESLSALQNTKHPCQISDHADSAFFFKLDFSY
jgi:hypothetical protein